MLALFFGGSASFSHDPFISWGNNMRRAKKAICRGESSRGESSRETQSTTPSTPVHPDSQEEIECSGSQQTSRHSFCGTVTASEEGMSNDLSYLFMLIHFILNYVDEQENPIRRRGRTTCADIQNMPPETRIHIEVNENNIPCNIPELILLGIYLGVVARDPILAPIAFPDWRNKGMEPFKKKMLAEVERQFQLKLIKCNDVNLLTNGQSQRTSLSRTDCNYEKSIGCAKMGPGHLRTLCSDGLVNVSDLFSVALLADQLI
ncbi:hypothetical protein IEQ34_016449 [Dendrobium chrysotoxum]|uniref:Uncharacterized protein n=1 Tax=Dendrobium chrysotoxum TaxID=161865 RepID=A0AAV7GE62_DENCH|nr:hypothetical protein IEQ34_016449 [Dendrobium chrysotoxum]